MTLTSRTTITAALIATVSIGSLLIPSIALANTTGSGLPATSGSATGANAATTGTNTGTTPATNSGTETTTSSTSTGGDFGLSDLQNEDLGVTQEPLEDYVGGIIGWITGTLGVIFLILVLVGGVSIATSAGNEGRVSFGRKVIAWGVIGLVLVFLSFIIARFLVAALTDGSDSLGTDPNSPYYGDPTLAPDDKWCNPPAGFICDRNVGGAIPAPGPDNGFIEGTPGADGNVFPSTSGSSSSGVNFGNYRSITSIGQPSLEDYPEGHTLRQQFRRLREANPNSTIVYDTDPGVAVTVTERIDPTHGCTAAEGVLCVR